MRTKLKPINNLIEELQHENAIIQNYKEYIKREEKHKEKEKESYEEFCRANSKTLIEYQTEISKSLKKVKVLMAELKKRDYE